MRGLCVFKGPRSAGRGVRLGVAVTLVALAAGLSGCSTVQGWLSGKDTVAAADAAPGSKDPYPALGSVPDRPKTADTPEQRTEIAKSLIADRDRVEYMDQQLRGGGDVSAPPPPAPVAGSETPAPQAATAEKAEEPGFFTWLFGRKKKDTAADEPAPVMAQPTGAVDASPLDGTAAPLGPTAN